MLAMTSLVDALDGTCSTTNLDSVLDAFGFNVMIVMVPIFVVTMIIWINDTFTSRAERRHNFDRARSEVLPLLTPTTPLSSAQWSLVQVRLKEISAEQAMTARSQRAQNARIARVSLLDKSEWRD